jgi:hypothetical protein
MNYKSDARKLPENPGMAACIFILAVVSIFLVGIPGLWWLPALSIAVGVGIAVTLRLIHGD